jgi:hypothetical protein
MDMGTDVDRIDRLRAELRRQRASCGCEVGSAFAMVGLVVDVALLTSGYREWTGWGSAGWLALWVVGLSLLGKLIGLAYARIRIVQLRRALARELLRTPTRDVSASDRRGVLPLQLAGVPAGPSGE